MPSPFPGMNPFLEAAAYWSGIHHRLIVAIANELAAKLNPKYFVAIEVRIYETAGEGSTLVGIPDNLVVKDDEAASLSQDSSLAVAAPPAQPITITVPIPETIKQGYLEVKDIGSGEVVTSLEILSPINKKAGEGRDKYEAKRLKIFGSSTHLVEIDLLRQGRALATLNNGVKNDYRVLVSRGDTRPNADLYAFNLRETIPRFPLPLQTGDAEPIIDLKAILDRIYDEGFYGRIVDYNREPVPALSATDGVWADNLLRQNGLRGV